MGVIIGITNDTFVVTVPVQATVGAETCIISVPEVAAETADTGGLGVVTAGEETEPTGVADTGGLDTVTAGEERKLLERHTWVGLLDQTHPLSHLCSLVKYCQCHKRRLRPWLKLSFSPTFRFG